MQTPEYRLQTLGGLSVRHFDRDRVALHGGKACVLLALLAASPGEWMTREQLAQLLWTGAPARRRRHSLRQLLSSIRKALSPEVLLEGPDGLKLDPPRWSVDLWEFSRAMGEGLWEDAARCYGGPFLGGFDADGGSELRALLDSIQAKYRVQAVEAFESVIQSHLWNGEARAAEQWARLFVGVDPTSERPRALLIEALRASGRHQDALGEFEEYRVLLDELIGDHPSSHLEALAAEVRAESEEKVPAGADLPTTPPAGVEPAPTPLAESSGASGAPRPSEGPGIRTPSPPAAASASPGRRPRSRRLWTGVLSVAAVALLVLSALHLRPPPPPASPPPALPALALSADGSREELLLLPTVSPPGEAPWSGSSGIVDPSGRFQVETVRTPTGYDFQVRALADSAVVVRRSGEADEVFLAWAPDGGSLLHASVRLSEDLQESYHQLAVLSVPEGRSVALDGLRPTVVGGASWSPRGTTIAVSASVGSGDHDLFLLSPDGEVQRHLDLAGDQVWPQWSPTGHLLAFESQVNGGSQIHVLADGETEPIPVEPEPVRQWDPFWLSDTLLVFLRDDDDGTQLRAIHPLAESESRVVEVDRPILALRPPRDVHRPEPWVHRIEPEVESVRTPPNSELRVGLDFFRVGDTPVEVPPEEIRWSSGDPEVAQVGPDGGIRTVGLGETVVTASLSGWREVAIPVAVVPLRAVPADTVLFEDWSAGLDTTRWRAFGEPLPYVRDGATPGGGAAFVNNGDGNYDSGVVSRRALDLSQGLTVEFQAAQPFNGQHFRGLRLVLSSSGEVSPSGERYDNPAIAGLTTNGFHHHAVVAIQREDVAELPLPNQVENWHHYVLQVEPTGTVTVLTDGRTTWRGNGGYHRVLPDSAFLSLSGRSVGTEVLLGPVTVYRGVRYRPEP